MQQALLAHSLLQCKIRCEDTWVERQKDEEGEVKIVENKVWRVGSGRRTPAGGGGRWRGSRLTTEHRRVGTHAPNHASVEWAALWELVEMKQSNVGVEEGAGGGDQAGLGLDRSASPSSLDLVFLKRAGERSCTLRPRAVRERLDGAKCPIVFSSNWTVKSGL